MEEFYKSNLKWKKLAVDGATSPHQVRDPNIVKTKGNPDKVASNFQKGRQCSRCKRIPGFQQYEKTITTPCEYGDPNNTPNENDMQPFCYSLME
ncbi:hypothetical protein AAG906_029575 [Vitis piasezkii]|uniref:Uncharacterized protein n=1 Tax=Vitis vinifera TaxID=29760 RepID=A0A438K6X4_VITVI|nr:hypothetical protein CK203_003419 [Vitis vinifera]